MGLGAGAMRAGKVGLKYGVQAAKAAPKAAITAPAKAGRGLVTGAKWAGTGIKQGGGWYARTAVANLKASPIFTSLELFGIAQNIGGLATQGIRDEQARIEQQMYTQMAIQYNLEYKAAKLAELQELLAELDPYQDAPRIEALWREYQALKDLGNSAL
jgi:hypothetical protein